MNRMLVGVTVDRSSSMSGNVAAVVQGCNQFVEQLSKEPLPVRLSLFLFDDEFETIYEAKPLGAVRPLTAETYKPQGSTALYDAIVKTIEALEGQELTGLVGVSLRTKVVVAILTDGEENVSETTEPQVKRRMAEKTALGWRFLILGADQRYTADLSRRLGLPAGSVKSFKANPAGVLAGFLTMATEVKGLLCE